MIGFAPGQITKMMNDERMHTAGRVLSAVVRDLTDEAIGWMLMVNVPGACRWLVGYYNENERKGERDEQGGRSGAGDTEPAEK